MGQVMRTCVYRMPENCRPCRGLAVNCTGKVQCRGSLLTELSESYDSSVVITALFSFFFTDF